MNKQHVSYLFGFVTLIVFSGITYILLAPSPSLQTGQAPTSEVRLDEVEALEERSEIKPTDVPDVKPTEEAKDVEINVGGIDEEVAGADEQMGERHEFDAEILDPDTGAHNDQDMESADMWIAVKFKSR